MSVKKGLPKNLVKYYTTYCVLFYSSWASAAYNLNAPTTGLFAGPNKFFQDLINNMTGPWAVGFTIVSAGVGLMIWAFAAQQGKAIQTLARAVIAGIVFLNITAYVIAIQNYSGSST